MVRRALTSLAVALTAATALPANAHAGSSFRVFTDRAAYLAAVAANGARSRPQITSGAAAVATDARSGRVGIVEYSADRDGAAATPRTTDGVLDLAADPTAATSFFFRAVPDADLPFVSAPAIGVSFRAVTPGQFTGTFTSFLNSRSETFDLGAGGSAFFGAVFDRGQAPLLASVTLGAPAGAAAVVTGLDVADAPTVTPEPATVALLAAGLAGVGLAARRRARA